MHVFFIICIHARIYYNRRSSIYFLYKKIPVEIGINVDYHRRYPSANTFWLWQAQSKASHYSQSAKRVLADTGISYFKATNSKIIDFLELKTHSCRNMDQKYQTKLTIPLCDQAMDVQWKQAKRGKNHVY